jgi:hypothetical protein
MRHFTRLIRPALIAGLLILAGAAGVRPAAAQNLPALCTQYFAQLKASGIATGIEIHGHAPGAVGYTLFVRKPRWEMLDPTAKEKVAHVAACFAVHGNPSVQVSGLIKAEGSNAQLGVLSMGGGFVAQ